MSNAEDMRKLINSVAKPQLDEAFGAPMGLGREIALWAKSFSNPAAAAQLTAGNYANQLNLAWRQAGLENVSAADFMKWYQQVRFGGKESTTKIGDQYVNQILAQVTNNDLSKILNDDDLKKIFLGLGQIQQKAANKLHTNLLAKGTQEQEAEALQIMQSLRITLPRLSQFSLAKLGQTIASVPLGGSSAAKQIPIKTVNAGMIAFARDYARIRPAPVQPLPQPFRVTNTRNLTVLEKQALIGKLADLVLEIVIANDTNLARGGGPQPPTPPPTPPANPVKDLTDLITDLRTQGFSDDMIRFIIANLRGGAPTP
jgi:hypothetical protein